MERFAVADFNGFEGALGHGAEVGRREGGVYGGAGGGFASDGGCRREVKRAGIGDGRVGILTFAEYAFKRVAGEPDDIAAGVHVEGNGLGSNRERQGVVASGREWQRHLSVVAETGGRAGGGGLDEEVGGVELCSGEGVG